MTPKCLGQADLGTGRRGIGLPDRRRRSSGGWQPSQKLPTGWKSDQKNNKTKILIGDIPAGWKISLAKTCKVCTKIIKTKSEGWRPNQPLPTD